MCLECELVRLSGALDLNWCRYLAVLPLTILRNLTLFDIQCDIQ